MWVTAIASVGFLLLATGDLRASDPTPSGMPVDPLVEQPPGTLQALVDAAAPGSTIDVPPGLYREAVVVRAAVTLRGAGAEIRGSDIWTAWSAADGGWISDDRVPDLYTGGTCAEPRCAWPEQVFVDGAPLLQVETDPDPGEFARDQDFRIVLGDDPTGHTVEVSTRQHWVLAEAPDVTVEGFAMRHVASAAQFGGIQAGAGGDRLTVRGVSLSDASGALVSFHDNAGGALLDSDLRGGGQLGVKGGGAGVRDLTIQGNRIRGNNTEGFESGWESGGIKLTNATSPVIVDNEISDNLGPGIWCDIDCTDAVITGNRVHDNSRAGIMFEISDGATIADNIVGDNGWGFATWGWGAGILVSSASGAVVRDNLVAWNADGISVVSQDRDGSSWDRVTDVVVESNTIVGGPAGAYLLAWLEDWDSGMDEPDAGNRGRDNRFWIAPDQEHDCQFIWLTCASTVEDFAETPGGAGSMELPGGVVSATLDEAGLPSPRPHEVNDPPRYRSLIAPAIIVGLAILVALGVVLALVVRRRRRRVAI